MHSTCARCDTSHMARATLAGLKAPLCDNYSLIALDGDQRYDNVEELRELMRHDSRFVWTALPCVDGGKAGEVFVRQRGACTGSAGEDDAQLRALLESDSIPQYVWPAASPLQQWVMAHSDVFAGKTVLELGCGTGVIGYTVARFAKLVVLTDCSAVSLAMALESLGRNQQSNCRVAALSWGKEEQLAHIKAACHLDGFDVVIGSDVFYFSSALKSGLATARAAFSAAAVRANEAIFVCGSVARSERMECDLDEMPGQEGFVVSHFAADGPFHLYCWKLAAVQDEKRNTQRRET